MQEDYVGKEDKTLDELKIRNDNNFIVETKKPGEKFEEIDPNFIKLKINLWKPDIEDLDD